MKKSWGRVNADEFHQESNQRIHNKISGQENFVVWPVVLFFKGAVVH